MSPLLEIKSYHNSANLTAKKYNLRGHSVNVYVSGCLLRRVCWLYLLFCVCLCRQLSVLSEGVFAILLFSVAMNNNINICELKKI